MPGLNIGRPAPNSIVIPDQDFTVSGTAFDRGWPEPTMIDSVSISVDNGPEISAQLTPGGTHPLTVFRFEAQVRVAAVDGPHTIRVTAVNDMNRSVTKSVTVYVGTGPLLSTFTGTSTVRTTHPRGPGPFVDMITAAAEFSADRHTVVLHLPQIRQVTNPQTDVTVTIEVTMVGGGTGSFNPADGSFAIPITLLFRVLVQLSVPIVGNITISDTTSTLSDTLTTASDTSPTGAFSDTGAPMDATGFVVLVADAQFAGGELNGHDASLVIAGTMSPRP
jgi:hypothetical protein